MLAVDAARLVGGLYGDSERQVCGPFVKLPVFLKLINTDPFAAWFVVTEDATPDGMRVVRSVLGAIRALSIVAFR